MTIGVRLPPGPGQESVWDYPRPPRLEPVARVLRVVLGAVTIARTSRGFRVLETSHPPTYYIPREDVRADAIVSVPGVSYCEWKGAAEYFDAKGGGRRAPKGAWSYPRPTEPFAAIAGHIAFYAGLMDACFVGDEQVTPQPGRVYGGWVTRDVVGPFKGEPGSEGW
jgi:uncharacterized protein (DUF427 family)